MRQKRRGGCDFDIAELHRSTASDDNPPIAAWDAAQRAARAAARAIDPTLDTSGLHAVRAAHQSTAIIDSDHWVKLDAVTGHALRAHELGADEGAAVHIVALTRRAIRSWRHLASLANLARRPRVKPTRSPEVLLACRPTPNGFRIHGARGVEVIEVVRHCSKGPGLNEFFNP
jgi:hypothetical protein